ncbi:MAG: hypothetical protein IT581_18590 [Verrucomicrobiales bacterium]|nr:hypothetical protein [Verrucomicrobiales bacterium]
MITPTQISIPDFGAPQEIPELPASLYQDRWRRIQDRLSAAGLNALIVYADREHSANLAYCTGFDPRFEEALFILTCEGQATLCLGNECFNVVSRLPVPAKVLLCQDFSLMGQDRSKSWDLAPLLAKAGLRSGTRCGIAGWKTLEAGRLEVPAYIVDLVTERCGRSPVNANDLFMHPKHGLRIANEPEQIAQFEYAATRTSSSILKLLRAIEPGKRCFELAANFDGGGLPYSCHPMVSCGRRIPNGMASPGNTPVAKGHFLTSAFGVWGALTCRAGWLTRHPESFAKGPGREVWSIIENYLTVTRAWYAAVSVGESAGDVWAQTDAARTDSLFTFCVNPGHYLHLDEWVSSPFWKGSRIPLPSGCALQADIIPVPRKGGASINMEDGIVLADSRLRSELKRRYPDLYQRCQARRRFMIDVLGYCLSSDVLPLGNIPGAYFPCLLDTAWVCRHDIG